MSENSLDSLDCSVNSPAATLTTQSDSEEGELTLDITDENNDKNKGNANSEGYRCRWMGCGIFFPQLEDMANHVTQTHASSGDGGLFFCGWNGCTRGGRGFNARYKMLVHVRTHTNEKPHRCFSCSKSFSRAENLKIHARTHTGERPYVCPVEGCGKAYSNSSDRFKHTRTHSVDKPYVCRVPGCPKRYTDPSSLRKHIKTFRHFVTNPETEETSTKSSDGCTVAMTSGLLGSGALVVTSESDRKDFERESDAKESTGRDARMQTGDDVLRSKLSCPPPGLDSKEWHRLLENNAFFSSGDCVKRPLSDKFEPLARSVKVCKEEKRDKITVRSEKRETNNENVDVGVVEPNSHRSKPRKSKGQSNSSAKVQVVPPLISVDGSTSHGQFNGYTPPISIDGILAQFGAAHMFGLGGMLPAHPYAPSFFGGWFSSSQYNGHSGWAGHNSYARMPPAFHDTYVRDAHSDCLKRQLLQVPFGVSQSEQLVPLDLSKNANAQSSLV